jgi:hypothetical protein
VLRADRLESPHAVFPDFAPDPAFAREFRTLALIEATLTGTADSQRAAKV